MMTASGMYPFEDQPDKVFLQLTAKPAVKQGDKWFCTVVVHAHLYGNINFPDCPLVLLVDGNNVGRATGLGDIVTNDQGLFSHPIQLPGPGRWLVGVKIKDTSIMAQEWVETPEEKKRRPEEEELALHRLRLEKAKVEQELAKLRKRPDSNEKKLADARLRLELARISAELKKLDAAPSDTEHNLAEARLKLENARIVAELEKLAAQPSSQERQLAETKLRLEQARVEKELAELQREPDQKEQELKEHRLELERAKIDAELAKLRAEPPRIPPKLSVEPLGFKPNLRFIIHLTDNEGRGTAGKVEVSNYAGEVWEVDVDASGSALWPPCDQSAITFAGKRRTYRFRIAGADPEDKTRARECVVS